MIRDFEFYHGTVFTRLIHASNGKLCVERFPTPDHAAYVLDGRIGIYVKYSAKRMPPWRFSFQRRHQDEMLQMRNLLENVFLLLVCHDDGIVTLSFDEVKRILDEKHQDLEWISVKRNRRQMYSVAGSDGQLEFKVGKQDFTVKVFEALQLSVEGKKAIAKAAV